MKTGKITSRYQLSLPLEFVKKLGLEAGQAVQFELKARGILVTPLVPLTKVRKSKGAR